MGAILAGMSPVPTLYLAVGLPGTGKTTWARQVERDQSALRLTKDEWVKALFGGDNPGWASDVIEGRLVEVALRALRLGVNVVLDFGLWGRDERTALRHAAAEVRAQVHVQYLALPVAEQRERIERRQRDEPHTTWVMSEADLAGYAAVFQAPSAAEVDGSEPLDPPPAGFATWEQWRHTRWPAARP